MNLIDSIWAFKLKRFPDRLIKKFKAHFCARGDRKLEGIDFFETYTHIVQWTTVTMMLSLEILLNLRPKQDNVTAAFLLAELGKNQTVYLGMPLGVRKQGKILKLNKALY